MATLTLVKSAGALAAVELRPSACRQHQPGIPHAATILKADQTVRNGVFPDGQVRAAPPPGFRIGIAARGLGHPGEKLQRQCVRGILHGNLNI